VKKFYFLFLVLLAACDSGPIHTDYELQMPQLPQAWLEVLDEPHWRILWLNSEGKWSSWEGRENFPTIPVIQEWTTPVLAWPYWPEKGLLPGQMSPAGALFPWDAKGSSIELSWKAGVDAFYWQELAIFQDAQLSSGTPRVPWNFDWPRFRELMESENIPSEVRDDPWLADWKEIAQKTAESGFDRRRIKAQAGTTLTISPSPGKFWIGYSSFAAPLEVDDGDPLVLKVHDQTETWISESGLLHCSSAAWIFVPF